MSSTASTLSAPIYGGLPRVSTPGVLFVGVGLVLLYLIVPPFLILLQTSFWVATGANQGYVGTDNYNSIASSPDLAVLLSNSLIFGLGSSVLGLFFGSLLAWLVERTNTPLKSVAYVSAFVALAVPGIIKAIGWVFLLGPRNGLFNVWIMELFHLESAPFNIYSLQGMILVEGLLWAPAVFLLMAVPFRSMDPSLEEAATASGASTLQTFRRVTFPLATPAVLSVLLLTFVRSIESFEIPAIVGIPGRVFVLTSEIYLKIRSGMFPNYGLASAYAVILIALVSVGIYYYSRATQEAQKFYTVTGKGFRPRLLDLGRMRFGGAGCVLLLPSLIAMPFAVLMWASVQPFYSRPSLDGLSKLTLKNYGGAFANTNVQHSLTNSLVIGLFTATLAVLLTAVIAWLLVRSKIPGRSGLDYLVSLTLVFPGVVLGVAMLRTYLTLDFIPIYGTIWLLVVGYVTRFVPYAMRYTLPGLIQIHQELEESAQISGANWLTVFRKILIPLMMPALFGAWIWVFLISVRELSMAVLLAGPKSQVVSSTIFSLWNDGQFTEMAAFSVVITSVFVVVALGLRRVSQRFGLQV